MSGSDFRRVANPLAGSSYAVFPHQFGFSAGSHVVPQLWPRLEPGFDDDAAELGAKILLLVSIPCDDVA